MLEHACYHHSGRFNFFIVLVLSHQAQGSTGTLCFCLLLRNVVYVPTTSVGLFLCMFLYFRFPCANGWAPKRLLFSKNEPAHFHPPNINAARESANALINGLLNANAFSCLRLFVCIHECKRQYVQIGILI